MINDESDKLIRMTKNVLNWRIVLSEEQRKEIKNR